MWRPCRTLIFAHMICHSTKRSLLSKYDIQPSFTLVTRLDIVRSSIVRPHDTTYRVAIGSLRLQLNTRNSPFENRITWIDFFVQNPHIHFSPSLDNRCPESRSRRHCICRNNNCLTGNRVIKKHGKSAKISVRFVSTIIRRVKGGTHGHDKLSWESGRDDEAVAARRSPKWTPRTAQSFWGSQLCGPRDPPKSWIHGVGWWWHQWPRYQPRPSNPNAQCQKLDTRIRENFHSLKVLRDSWLKWRSIIRWE